MALTTLRAPAAAALASPSAAASPGLPPSPAAGRWTPAFGALLAATAALYLCGLDRSGWANTYYSAAVQAGTKSWKAFFFGSTDARSFITVDKSPASLWVMGIAARLFGVNAWSVLVPQALEGVAAVAVLYAAVRRWSGPAAGLLAGAVLATTPIAALIFRFNNPDALLVLLLTAGAYFLVRAVEDGRTRSLVLAGSMVGFGFLAKMLQALVVLPVFAGVYLLAGPPKLGRRIVQLAWGGLAVLVSAGWWIAAVQLTPAGSRPYIGGSQDNSLWNLMFGYNGFGRLTGDEAGSVGGAGRAASRWGPVGWTRMFNAEFGAQASWLIPAALVLLVAGLVWRQHARAARTDRVRAALLLWGGWMIVTAVVFSLGQGIIHPYYTVALGPGIGGVIGVGAAALWQHRSSFTARAVLAAAVAAAAGWSYVLLDRVPAWHPGVRQAVLAGGVLAAMAVMVAAAESQLAVRVAVGGAAVVFALAGPGAYAVATAATPHSGAIPSAGPAGQGRFGPGPQGGGGRTGAFGGLGRTGGPGAAGAGGLLNGSVPTPELTTVLDEGASRYSWVAATVGANTAAGYQLATDDPVMAIGGFNGTDPAPTLAQFQQLVRKGRIHWFIGGPGGGGGFGGFGGPGGTSASTPTTASQISSWVESTFTSRTIGGVTLYDLTSTT